MLFFASSAGSFNLINPHRFPVKLFRTASNKRCARRKTGERETFPTRIAAHSAFHRANRSYLNESNVNSDKDVTTERTSRFVSPDIFSRKFSRRSLFSSRFVFGTNSECCFYPKFLSLSLSASFTPCFISRFKGGTRASFPRVRANAESFKLAAVRNKRKMFSRPIRKVSLAELVARVDGGGNIRGGFTDF